MDAFHNHRPVGGGDRGRRFYDLPSGQKKVQTNTTTSAAMQTSVAAIDDLVIYADGLGTAARRLLEHSVELGSGWRILIRRRDAAWSIQLNWARDDKFRYGSETPPGHQLNWAQSA